MSEHDFNGLLKAPDNEVPDILEKNDKPAFETKYSLLIKSNTELKKSLEQDEGEVPKQSDNQENKNVESQEEDSHRPFIKRLLGPMEAGSLRGSIFAISSLALGTGCLSLPLRFAEMGLLWGIIFLTIGGLVAYWSLSIMIIASEGSDEKDYSRLVYKTLGNFPSVFLDISIMLYIFGVLVFFQVVINQMLGYVLFNFFLYKHYTSIEDFYEGIWHKKIYQLIIMFTLSSLLIPFCLLKDISKMRFASFVSIMSLFYVILVVVFQTYKFYKNYSDKRYIEDDPSTHANYFDIRGVFDPHMKIFAGFATIFFSFTCQVGAFPVYKTLKNNITRRINKVFRRSILLDFGIYIVVGVTGFLTAPINTPDLIVKRDWRGVLSNDVWMTLGKLALALNLMMSTPANYNSFRMSFFQLVWQSSEISKKRNIIVTLGVIYIATLIAALYSEISSYISLLGGFLSVIISFLMPGLIYIKTNINRKNIPMSDWRNISSLILIIVLCTIGWISGVETFLFDIIKMK